MHTYNHIKDYQSSRGSVVTIGTFDGVHKGHQNILKRVREIAEQQDLTSILLTFFPHPRMILQPEHPLQLINTIKERVGLIENGGIEHAIIHPFSTEFARTTAASYVKDILVDQLGCKVVVIGYDHRFGRNRSASIEDLYEYGKELDFEVVEISKKEVDAVAVSSTKIRTALASGDIAIANSYLNRSYSMRGIVIMGKQIGRTLGYPTANLKVEETYKLIPARGVYLTEVVVNGTYHFGLTSIGTNPTINVGNATSIETHILDHHADLYGQELELHFIEFLRGEVKFNDTDELVQAMKRDEKHAREIIQRLG
ncbi:MAG: bifunctional riboflavin kinase/FAD synthetase [Nonlabens sp.]